MEKISIVVDVQGKIFKTGVDQKNFYFGSDPKLTLTLSLTLGLGLGVSPGKTISVQNLVLGLGLTNAENTSVQNLKPNGKDQYRRRRQGKIFKTGVD